LKELYPIICETGWHWIAAPSNVFYCEFLSLCTGCVFCPTPCCVINGCDPDGVWNFPVFCNEWDSFSCFVFAWAQSAIDKQTEIRRLQLENKVSSEEMNDVALRTEKVIYSAQGTCELIYGSVFYCAWCCSSTTSSESELLVAFSYYVNQLIFAAEVNHFQHYRVGDFASYMLNFLNEQIAFHQKVSLFRFVLFFCTTYCILVSSTIWKVILQATYFMLYMGDLYCKCWNYASFTVL